MTEIQLSIVEVLISGGILIALIFTAVIVWHYTVATQKANKIQVRPIVNFYVNREESKIYLKNIGKGIAYNVAVKDVEFELLGAISKFFFDSPNILLGPGEEMQLLVYSGALDGSSVKLPDTSDFFNLVGSSTQGKDKPEVIVQLSYVGADGDKHTSRFKLYEKKLSFGSSGAVVEFLSYS